MPLTELHRLALEDKINQENIKLHLNDINTPDDEERWGSKATMMTPLHTALLKRNTNAICFLLAYGASVHTEFLTFRNPFEPADQWTAITYCAAKFPSTAIEILINSDGEKAEEILIKEKLLDAKIEVIKFVKSAKH